MIHLEQISATSRVRYKSAPVSLFYMGLLTVALVAPVFPGSFFVIISAWGMAWGIARVPILLSLRLLSLPLGFLSVSLCTLCISLQFSADGLSFHWASSQFPVVVQTGLRSMAALSATISLALCVPMGRMFSMLRTLRIPDYFLEFMMLMYRMVFLLDDSRHQIWYAQKNRLGDVNFRSAFRSLSMLISVLFIQSQFKAMRMEQGLTARCCSGGFVVASPPQPSIPKWVWGLSIAWPILLILIAFKVNPNAL